MECIGLDWIEIGLFWEAGSRGSWGGSRRGAVVLYPMKEAANLPFVIEAEEVKRLQAESGLGLEAFLATLVEPTRALARTPISKFHVGAVGLGSSGRVFRGVNIEFSGVPLNCSIHAEQFLVANAARNGEQRLQFLAVSAAPCGHCRQFLQELRGAGDIRILIADEKAETEPLSHFLPHRFGPQDLLEDDFPLLLETQSNNLHFAPLETLPTSKSIAVHDAWPSPSDEELTARSEGGGALNSSVDALNGLTVAEALKHDQDLKSADRILATLPNFVARHLANSPALFSGKFPAAEGPPYGDQSLSPEQLGQLQQASLEAQQLIVLRNAALDAANASYSPYTNSPSGLAFLTTGGDVYRGPYFESAAYNPSLPPLQTAIVAFVAEGGGSFEEISKVVLVEKEGSPVRQAGFVRLALEQITPKASFHVFQAQSS